MDINIIDYRGDGTVINTRGESLYQYRTRYLHRIQADFAPWKSAGHRFHCFTQHDNHHLIDDFWNFDTVTRIDRCNAATARNHVLDAYPKDEWIGIWDNDASVYVDKLDTRNFIKDVDGICKEAESKGIVSFVPFNAQQSPYPKNPKRWRPRVEQKGTMMFLRVMEWRYDESLDCLEDLENALRLSQQGHLFAQTDLCSVKEYQSAKSTIFAVDMEGTGRTAQQDRVEKYARARAQIENKLGDSIDNIKKQHTANWQNKHVTNTSKSV